MDLLAWAVFLMLVKHLIMGNYSINCLKEAYHPHAILRFLSCWYQSQQMRVKWSSALSDGFCVSNGVRQGSVLSPVLFAVYLDGLLVELSSSGVGCYWGCMFAGSFCYADDIVLLAPCASALRCMLNICCRYAFQHGLKFNANKTQLICFCKSKSCSTLPTILFNDTIYLNIQMK